MAEKPERSLPEHIREGNIIQNAFGHELHIVAIFEKEGLVVLRMLHTQDIFDAHLHPFFESTSFRFERKATRREIEFGQNLLRERERKTKKGLVSHPARTG
ncbi:MAG: hypothetical protein HZC02_02785 [Candidatus Levybacteria bacterium]|nr:hypothetical protein [Candidatus Levybacteria bacterium]